MRKNRGTEGLVTGMDRDKRIEGILDRAEQVLLESNLGNTGKNLLHALVERDIPHMLEEIERLTAEYADERAAHNSHVTELCLAEAEIKRLKEEKRRLHKIHDQQYAHIEKLMGEASQLREERDDFKHGYIMQQTEIVELQQQVDTLTDALSKIKRMLDNDHSDYQKYQIWNEATVTLQSIKDSPREE